MASVYRFRAGLSGWLGGPGVNTWFATSGTGSTIDPEGLGEFWAKVRAFYDAVDIYLVGNYRVDFDGSYDELDAATGNLIAKGSISTLTPITTPGGASSTSRATMAKLQAVTSTIVNNRVLRGGIYLGPVSNSCIASDGSLSGSARGAIQTAATDIISGDPVAKWAIWSQPRDVGGVPSVGAVGAVTQVSLGTVPAVLRSRRD